MEATSDYSDFPNEKPDRSSFWVGLCVLTLAYTAAVFAVRVLCF